MARMAGLRWHDWLLSVGKNGCFYSSANSMPQAKANAATAAELVRWLWALGMMCREAGE